MYFLIRCYQLLMQFSEIIRLQRTFVWQNYTKSVLFFASWLQFKFNFNAAGNCRCKKDPCLTLDHTFPVSLPLAISGGSKRGQALNQNHSFCTAKSKRFLKCHWNHFYFRFFFQSPEENLRRGGKMGTRGELIACSVQKSFQFIASGWFYASHTHHTHTHIHIIMNLPVERKRKGEGCRGRGSECPLIYTLQSHIFISLAAI